MNFERGKDPKKAMGIGFGKKAATKGWKILDFIGSKGEEGASYTEIQEFIFVELNGGTPEDFQKKDRRRYVSKFDTLNQRWHGEYQEPGLRKSRGYYSTALSGTRGWAMGDKGNKGLLHAYCFKNEKGKWVLDRMPNPGENIYSKNESMKLVPESLNEMLNKNRDI